ncbi:unnamed protein product [Acanthoscelides obtectus]|uniref:Uncharacterized protein n=1 Tax=Acanthoscelides obtectus TaxID=200917 RepID=A0A9P0NVX2_ACAOB|nr:unnamed protein product [Acanthoscelides obtectus]CAK1621317.1 hypothetical protein AOBTE_LOCUS892 [Acanthoscelides obtectus]
MESSNAFFKNSRRACNVSFAGAWGLKQLVQAKSEDRLPNIKLCKRKSWRAVEHSSEIRSTNNMYE